MARIAAMAEEKNQISKPNPVLKELSSSQRGIPKKSVSTNEKTVVLSLGVYVDTRAKESCFYIKSTERENET